MESKAETIALEYAINRNELSEIKKELNRIQYCGATNYQGNYYNVDLSEIRDNWNSIGYAWNGWVRAIEEWNGQFEETEEDYYLKESPEYKFCVLLDRKKLIIQEAGTLKRRLYLVGRGLLNKNEK